MKKALRKLYFLLSPKQRRLIRRLYYTPADTFNAMSGRVDPLVPPQGLIFTGAGDFKQIGRKFVDAFVAEGNLRTNGRVLDVGCGIGRIARPLTAYLNADGQYHGFDIVETGIKWCTEHYQAFPNFFFKYVPLRNDLYNLSTKNQASEFAFPYDTNYFDLVVLTSVFTHMQEADFKQYVAEIARVLKPGGICFSTFFLITPQAEEYLKQADEPFFLYSDGNYLLHDARVKDANIAYRYSFVEEVLAASGLNIRTYKPGWWAGKDRDKCFDFQDLLIISSE